MGNGCNFGTKLLLDFVEIEAIFPIDQVDRDSQVSKSSRPTDAVEVGLRILREIEVDNYIDSLNVDTSGKKIRADKIAAYTVPEVMKHTVAVVLQHFGVRVEAGVSELRDLLR